MGWAAVAARVASKRRTGHQRVDHAPRPDGEGARRPARRRSSSTATPSARPGRSTPWSCRSPSSSGWGPALRLRACRSASTPTMPGGCCRAWPAAVAAASPCPGARCSRFAVREQFDPLIHFDEPAIIWPPPTSPGARALPTPLIAAPGGHAAEVGARVGTLRGAVGLAGQGAAQPAPCGPSPPSWSAGASATSQARRPAGPPRRHRPGLARPRVTASPRGTP